MTEPVAVPVAIEQKASEGAPLVGHGVAPPTTAEHTDPALTMFTKIAAERRERLGEAPISIPFGSTVLRIHRSMPASFALDLAVAEVDPAAAIRALKSVVVTDDSEKFEAILKLPPDNADSIDGAFLLAFLGALGEFYGGAPLAG